MAQGNPLRDALPPATDYLTYLTIVEYNLTTESLPTLHEILQDTKLTTNIGWDLIHLLLPLLPASEECLQDIARLGNPREVILKATESLRLIDRESLESDNDDEERTELDAAVGASQYPAKTAAVDAHQYLQTQAVELPAPPPLPVMQFTTLLSMLSTLHPRIKTRYPSRFLSSTLQAILAAFPQAASHHEELVSAVVRFVKDLSGVKRPHLPPRQSSSSVAMAASSQQSAPDPEADTDSDHASVSEIAMQQRLLQSFLTHILEEYILGLKAEDDLPGLAWSVRLQERLHPERTIPGTTSTTDRFSHDPMMQARSSAVGDILALARDLGITSQELRDVTESEEQSQGLGNTGDDEEHPKTAADIPLSTVGSLLLYTARCVVGTLYAANPAGASLDIFPDHQRLLNHFTSGSSSTGSTVGSESAAILDALLALALLSVESNQIGAPKDSEQFNRYLQVLALISSNCPSPALRYQAYYLTTTILRSNPSDVERLAFIRDTLEHCPFDNLKVAAVSWIKGETIEANPGTPSSSTGPSSSAHTAEVYDADDPSVFATPIALDTLAPYLFPDLTHDLAAPDVLDSWQLFDQNLHFYLASLNFYFLLLSAKHLHKALNIGDLHTNNDIAGSFLQPLREASTKYREEAKEGGQLTVHWKSDGDVNVNLGQLELMNATLEKVTKAVAGLNES